MKRFLVIAVFLLLGQSAFAQTCSVASPIYTATTAAELADCFFKATHTGDRVHIPTGIAITLTSALSWSAPANSELYGDGTSSGTSIGTPDVSYIIDQYLTQFSPLVITVQAGTFQIYGLTIQGGTVGGANNDYAKYDGMISIYGASTQIRVHHVHIRGDAYDRAENSTGIQFNGCTSGVVDHILWSAPTTNQNNALKQHNQQSCSGDSFGQGDASWNTATGLGAISPDKFIYVENSTFNYGAANDCTYGGRFVYRFNTITTTNSALAMQTHPTAGQRTRGCRAYEIYANRLIAGEYAANAIWLSAGTGVVWGNEAHSTNNAGGEGYANLVSGHAMRYNNGTYGNATTPTGWGYSGTHQDGNVSNWDGNSIASTGYPALDQPGRGIGDRLVNDFPNVTNQTNSNAIYSSTGAWPRQALEPIYNWINDLWNVPNESPSNHWSSAEPLFTENTDYYLDNAAGCTGTTCTTGVGSGTTLPTHCTVGTGYWKTNEGSWNDASNSLYMGQGVLYKCTTTNDNWVLFYTPYTFPHPLTGASAPPGPTGSARDRMKR